MFSTAVKIIDLNDYLGPANECVVQTSQQEKPELIKEGNQKAEVWLEDCLACNGCLTTSETILLQEQSINKLETIIQQSRQEQNSNIILLVTNQSLFSIQKQLKLPFQETLLYIQKQLAQKDIKYILECSLFNEIICELEYQSLKSKQFKGLSSSCECPGWIAYLEKVLQKDYFYIASQIITPQLLAAIVTKQLIQDSKVILLASCYDKKLESIKFKREEQSLIDLVITTGEFYEWIQNGQNKVTEQEEKGNQMSRILSSQEIVIHFIQNAQLNLAQTDDAQEMYRCFWDSGESNGYINYITERIKEDYQDQMTTEIIQERGIDTVKIVLQENKQEIFLSYVYGFKNISNLIRKIKRKQTNVNYAEIMACPGGCIKGGGQIKDEMFKQTAQEDSYQEYYCQQLIYKTSKELTLAFINKINKEELVYGLKEVKTDNNLNPNW